jgi:hypothetical protein|tara:strand:+ start:1807 stop:1986 length:180 start_codon:yes stop_codon:yes gene_type:complete
MNRQSANGGVIGINNVISQGDGTVTTFTANGNYTAPATVSQVRVLLVAGGGSGGSVIGV